MNLGPLLLSIFNSLLKHLRTSVDFERSSKCKDSAAEKMYQEALINAMGDFANALPDYQKVRSSISILPLNGFPGRNDDVHSRQYSITGREKIQTWRRVPAACTGQNVAESQFSYIYSRKLVAIQCSRL